MFEDKNRDGTHDPDGTDGIPGNGDDEINLPGWEIRAYADTNPANGQLDAAETSTIAASDITDANGAYSLSLTPGDYIIVEVSQTGWRQTAPAIGKHEVTVTAGQAMSNIDFGSVENGNQHLAQRLRGVWG